MNYRFRHMDTFKKEHEKMIQSTQRKMLRLIIQTKRKKKRKTQVSNEEKEEGVGRRAEKQEEKRDEKGMKEESRGCSEEEAENGYDSNSVCDQDSDISFMNETDEEIDTGETEEEECIEYMKKHSGSN